METTETTVTCRTPEHLRALACRLIRQGLRFRAHPDTLEVGVESDPDDPDFVARALEESKTEEVHFDFSAPESWGRLTVGPGSYGPTLTINGVTWGFIDFFYSSPEWLDEGRNTALTPQLLLFDPHYSDEAWAKVFLDADQRMAVIVHKDAADLGCGEHPRGFHSVSGDRAFSAPVPVKSSEAPQDAQGDAAGGA